MKPLLAAPVVLAGMFFAFLAFVAGSGTVLSLFTDAHPLTIGVGNFEVTSLTLHGKIVGAVACVLLSFLAYVFLVVLPDRIYGRRKGWPSR